MKNITMTVLLNLLVLTVNAQSADFSVKQWNAPLRNPLVLYISGDGGLNDFSTGVCTAINKAGYCITALNARSYFWEKKTPDFTANDITVYLEKQFKIRNNRQFYLAGYSFGADVLPFIINKLSDSIKKNLLGVVLLSPTTTTDFEIHLWDMLSNGKKRSMDVVAEINRMNILKSAIICGSDETGFPVNNISIKNCSKEKLPGGHHFEGNINEVANTMLKHFK